MGTGVATAQKIIQWPTPFLTRHSASSVGRGYSNEQSPPRSHAYRRVHTDRSDPTILQYSDIRRYSNLTAGQAKTWCQRNKARRHTPKTSLRQSGMGKHADTLEMAKRVPELHLPIKDLVFGKVKDAKSPFHSQWVPELRKQIATPWPCIMSQ